MRALILVVLAVLATSAVGGAAPPTASCTVASLTIAFGSYNVFSATDQTTSGRIKVMCSGTSASNAITITSSAGASGSFAARTLVSGQDTLTYNLYLDSNEQTVWGDGAQGSSAYVGALGTFNLTIYGKIPAGQDAATGSYNDALVTTINF